MAEKRWWTDGLPKDVYPILVEWVSLGGELAFDRDRIDPGAAGWSQDRVDRHYSEKRVWEDHFECLTIWLISRGIDASPLHELHHAITWLYESFEPDQAGPSSYELSRLTKLAWLLTSVVENLIEGSAGRNAERDRWLSNRRKDGKSLAEIQAELEGLWREKDWYPIRTAQGVAQAISRFNSSNGP